MTHATIRLAVGLCLAATACSKAPAPDSGGTPTPTATPTPTPMPPTAGPVSLPDQGLLDYTGRWTGVEGMFLDVARGAGPKRFRLTMQYDLDHKATADARLVADSLVFTRDGKELTLRPTNGDATGLKYLAGKKDCLTVAPGEGYCRD